MKKRNFLIAALLAIIVVGVVILQQRGEEEEVCVAAQGQRCPQVVRDSEVDEEQTGPESGNNASRMVSGKRNLSVAVSQIVDDSGDILKRVRLVNRLSDNLSAADRQALYDYLKYGPDNRETHHLKNDILNVLRSQLTPPPELTQVMLDIFYDERQSMTMRSYALQHMRPWYWEENMRDPAVKQAFYDGLEQSGNELSGVALLALAYLSEELPDEFDRVFIVERAAVLAGSPEVSALTRVSALDVSSRNGNASALEVARGILAAEEESLMLRAAACGAIGRQGNASDLELLARAGRENPGVRAASDAAAKKITDRSGVVR